MNRLKELNEACAAFAASHKIRASVHLPSEFVLTIPRGYEQACRDHLRLAASRSVPVPYIYTYAIDISIPDFLANKTGVLHTMLARLLERQGLPTQELLPLHFSFDIGALDAFLLNEGTLLHVNLTREDPISTERIQQLLVEIFHTDNFHIREID